MKNKKWEPTELQVNTLTKAVNRLEFLPSDFQLEPYEWEQLENLRNELLELARDEK